jgi:hypothetical protein
LVNSFFIRTPKTCPARTAACNDYAKPVLLARNPATFRKALRAARFELHTKYWPTCLASSGNLARRNFALQQFLQRRGLTIGNAAGNNQFEVAQIGGHVIRKTVRSDPAADVHADGGQLFFGAGFADPNSSLTSQAMRTHF